MPSDAELREMLARERVLELAGYLCGLAKVYRAFPQSDLWGMPDQAEYAASLTEEAAERLAQVPALFDRIDALEKALRAVSAIRPTNWDDDDDVVQLVAWRAVDSAIEGGKP